MVRNELVRNGLVGNGIDMKTAKGFVLAMTAVLVFIAMMAHSTLAGARQRQTPDSATALVGDIVDRWWLLAVAVPCLALVLRIGFVRYGRPWLSSRLRDARISQRTDLLSDIRDC